VIHSAAMEVHKCKKQRISVNRGYISLLLPQVYYFFLTSPIGRLMDIIRNKILDISNLKILVVDEADMMIDRGFVGQIKELL
jgi:hypothetical protein